ncbi:MAG: sulfatase-like hydrolase/transferase [Pseudomonadota bacterium]
MLAAFRDGHDDKPLNVIKIQIDDVGFGDPGIPGLNAARGYSTANINAVSDEAMRIARMYIELCCTPIRVAMVTGCLAVRMGMGNTTVDIPGFGLPEHTETVAEILSDSGYVTAHVCKRHMGDTPEAWPTIRVSIQSPFTCISRAG